eukprot:SAG22_NODE_3686_length_1578_cov_43.668019_2_plen_178_part_00
MFAVLFEGLLYTHDPKTKQMTLRCSDTDLFPTGEQVVGKFDYKQMKIKWDKHAIRYHRRTLLGLIETNGDRLYDDLCEEFIAKDVKFETAMDLEDPWGDKDDTYDFQYNIKGKWVDCEYNGKTSRVYTKVNNKNKWIGNWTYEPKIAVELNERGKGFVEDYEPSSEEEEYDSEDDVS